MDGCGAKLESLGLATYSPIDRTRRAIPSLHLRKGRARRYEINSTYAVWRPRSSCWLAKERSAVRVLMTRSSGVRITA